MLSILSLPSGYAWTWATDLEPWRPRLPRTMVVFQCHKTLTLSWKTGYMHCEWTYSQMLRNVCYTSGGTNQSLFLHKTVTRTHYNSFMSENYDEMRPNAHPGTSRITRAGAIARPSVGRRDYAETAQGKFRPMSQNEAKLPSDFPALADGRFRDAWQ